MKLIGISTLQNNYIISKMELLVRFAILICNSKGFKLKSEVACTLAHLCTFILIAVKQLGLSSLFPITLKSICNPPFLIRNKQFYNKEKGRTRMSHP